MKWLKENWKYLLFLVLGGIFIYLVYVLIGVLKNDIDKSVKYDRLLILKSTLTKKESKAIAQSLLDAMDMYGTKEEYIVNILKNLTRYDFEKVYKEFGKVSYNGITGIKSETWSYFEGSYHDLRYWLESELSQEEYDLIKTVFGRTTPFPFGVAHELTAEQYYLTK